MKNKFIIALSLFIAVVCTVFIFVGVISGNDSLEKQTGTEKNVPAHTESDGTQQPSVSDENSAGNSSSSSSVNGGSDAQDTLGLKDSNINDDDNNSQRYQHWINDTAYDSIYYQHRDSAQYAFAPCHCTKPFK